MLASALRRSGTRLILVLSLATQGCSVASGAQSLQFPSLRPIDEAVSDASLVSFRRSLITALEKKDRQFVNQVVDPGIAVGFGPESGAAAFYAQWNLENPADPFWETLLRTLRLGGQFVDNRRLFCAPYVFTAFPSDLDAFDHYVVTEDNVALRSAADPRASIVRLLSYSIVKSTEFGGRASEWDSNGQEWTAIAVADDVKGYVPSAAVRSPLDYRACFERKGGVWKLTSFAEGD
jgi:hypothetical protein